jgi:hypothetical protein
MARKTKSPSDMSSLILSKKSTLSYITEKTNSLTQLNDIVRQTCPDLPEDVWHIANFNQNKLVIEVNSSVWSQRLQFERMKISHKLSEVTQGQFNQIEIKVSPYRNKVASSTNTKVPTQTTNISHKSANKILEIAQNAPKSLKEKLEKLASHAKD